MTGLKGDMSITMYGTDSCSDCMRARAWFKERGLDYHYVNLVDYPAETERVPGRDNGVEEIPAVVFPDGSQLVQPSNDELSAHVALLADAGIHLNGAAVRAGAERPVVVENADLGRFELLHDGGVVSFATYTSNDQSITVPHVETAPEHGGNGHAAQLMEGLLRIIRDDGRTITPRCSFAAAHIRDNQQHHDLVTSEQAIE
jgi:predicted GNAT family acetyltransferase/glutaredoxin